MSALTDRPARPHRTYRHECLRKTRPIIQRFCQDSSITYQRVTILRAWAIVAGYLNTVGLAARDPFRCPMVTALRPR